jgi:aldose sugar dehydrogenase
MNSSILILISIEVFILFYGINSSFPFTSMVYGQEDVLQSNSAREESDPYISDPKLKLEVVATGFELPTTMAFLGPNDFLMLEKDKGTVLRVIDGKVLDKPLLDVNVANSVKQGLSNDLLSLTYGQLKTLCYMPWCRILP